MATVFDVAKYILEKQGSMTTMKLQKLCYYSQAWSLAWDEVPLFDEEFEAWAKGPVCPQLFKLHSGQFMMSLDDMRTVAPHNELSGEQKDTIEKVMAFYGPRDPVWLSELTHKEAPWLEARCGLPPDAPCRNVISKDIMQEYYGGL